MAHEVHASIRVQLADDPQQMAEGLSEIAAAWAALLGTIDPIPCDQTFTITETRSRGNGASKPRKPRTPAAPQPELPEPFGVVTDSWHPSETEPQA